MINDTWLALEFTYDTPLFAAFDLLRWYYPTGPIMVLEFYPAWFDCEGILPHQTLDPTVFANAVDGVLSYNASLSIYPVFGGTKYAFLAVLSLS